MYIVFTISAVLSVLQNIQSLNLCQCESPKLFAAMLVIYM